MRLLLDLCVSSAVLTASMAEGHDAVRVGTGLEERGDEVVLARAHAERRVIVTIDKDFGEILMVRRGLRVGVLRVLDLPPSRQVEFVLAALALHGGDLERGPLVVAEPGRTRIRYPPPDPPG